MAIAAKKPHLEGFEAELLKINSSIKNTESLMEDIGKVQKELNVQCKYKISEAEEKFKDSVALENKNFEKLSENVNELKAKCDALFEQEKKLNQEKNGIEASIAGEKKAIVDYATDIAKKELNDAEDGIKEANQYKKIVEKTTNENPIRNAKTISKGLQEVTNIYRNYHSSYNWFQRFFRFPGTNAARDYNLFSRTRSMYMEFSGIKIKEINTYLDKKQLTGDLKKYVEESNLHPEEKTNTIIDKDFNAKQGANMVEYAQKAKELFYKNFEISNKEENPIGAMYLNMDRGLRILNGLGDARRKSGNLELDTSINEISKVLKKFSNKRSTTIDQEIANALLPKEQRKEIPLELPQKHMEFYLTAKGTMEQNMIEEENVILNSVPKQIEIEKNLVEDPSKNVNAFHNSIQKNQEKERNLEN